MGYKVFTDCIEFVGTACNLFVGTKKYISTGAVDIDHIIESDVELVDYEGKPSRANLEVSAGDILFAKMQGTKKTLKIDEVLSNNVYSTGFCAVRAKKGILTERCLYHLLTSRAFLDQKDKNCSGATQKAITNAGLSKINVRIPDYSEQDVLADKLDALTKIINQRRIEIQYLDDLIKARFVEMFGDPVSNPKGWRMRRFDSICENLDSRRKPITASEREAGEYPYYGASGIVDYVADYIFDEDILLVSEDGANLLMRSTPIAFSVSGKVWVNNHAHVVRFNDMGLQKYIEVFFSMIDISDQITGSAQPKLNQAKLNAMQFPIPDKELTDSFFGFIAQVDKSKFAVQKALDEAQLLFDSLMQQYFG